MCSHVVSKKKKQKKKHANHYEIGIVNELKLIEIVLFEISRPWLSNDILCLTF